MQGRKEEELTNAQYADIDDNFKQEFNGLMWAARVQELLGALFTCRDCNGRGGRWWYIGIIVT